MPTERGTVEALMLSRIAGKVDLRLPGGSLPETFWLYMDDSDVDVIDPTEMVRRNWMIGLLQQAAVHRLEVSIDHSSETDAMVDMVTLHAPARKPTLGLLVWTTGTVKRIKFESEKGVVTVHGSLGPAFEPSDHDFLIYDDEKRIGAVSAEESSRRSRIVGILRQALADGLEVSVIHGTGSQNPIIGAVLHAKE